MRSTIGITEKNSGRSANWRAWIIVVAVAGGVAALLAGGFNWRAARAAAAQQSGTWTYCANEGATCTFTGTKRVRYGAGGTYSFATFTGGVQCSNEVFGDPVSGVVKSCDYQDQLLTATPTATPTPAPTPDYSNVNDILNGRRHLLRADDLAFSEVATGYTRFLQTTDSAISKDSGFIAGGPPHDSAAIQIGRMFNLSADVVVRLFVANNRYISLHIYHPPTHKSHNQTETGQFVGVQATKMADFNGDGFDDLVVYIIGVNRIKLTRIYTARDVNNLDLGLEHISETNLNFETDTIGDDALTVGDFDGDGQPEIIGVSPQNGTGLQLVRHTVDAKTSRISDGVHFPLTIPEGAVVVPHLSAAAGRFTTTTHDQLLIAYATNPGTAKVKLIDFVPAPFQPQERSLWDTGHEIKTGRYGVFDWTGLLRLKVGRFNWSSQYDQPLLLHGNNFHRVAGTSSSDFTLSTLAINPVDSSIKEQSNLKTGDQYGTVYDLVLGNFDRRDPDPLNPQQKDRNPNLQAALLSTDYTGSTAFANIYNIDPLTLAPKQATTHNFSIPPPNGGVRFVAGDLQGRSLILGEPTKIVIDGTTQPTVVTAAPPMHVDYMAAVGARTPTVLNLSAIPGNFYTSYQTDEKSSNQSSSTHTSSWSFGAKESVGTSFEIGSVEKGEGTKFSDTFTAAQDLKGSTENVHGTYDTHSFDISQQTGFSDQLWYSQSRFNIYIYPVIGQTVCPQGKPNCQENEKVPLTIQFSGPDQTHTETVAASQAEWYQPPWEYGNVLSYPGSYAQLQQIVPDIDKLSKDLTWATDASTFTEKTTWATGSSDSKSTSLKQNYSFENDFSVQGASSVFGFATLGFSFEVDISGSFGFSDLNKATTNLGKSTGIEVHKPNSFLDPGNYSYFVTPHIFGQKQKGGQVDDIELKGDVQTFGLLRTAFTVDPTRSNAGGWWKQAYTKAPDVALNHPNRWQINVKPLSNPIPPNCLPLNEGAARMNCAEKSNSSPDNPWMSEFHDMRGLFISNITNGNQPGKGPGQGPQIETAKAGDKLALRARVHNYSLAQMGPDAKVRVRFYGMEWNPSNNCPAGTTSSNDDPCPAPANTKASFLIGEDVLPPIPPFSSDPGAPLNWVLAGTTFDTTPYADKDLVFWVVVWMEKADGKPISELPGHGLSAIPADFKNIVDASRIEEEFSNNVGFYKSAFHVFKPSRAARLGAEPNGPDHLRPDHLRLGRVKVSTHKSEIGQSVEVSTLLRMRTGSASGVTVVFYDGDPAKGGKAFDVERIPHLRAGVPHEVKVTFRPRDCGEHQIFVSAAKGKPFETSDSSRVISVGCAEAAPVCGDPICFRSPEYYRNKAWNGLPRGEVWIGGSNSPVSTSNAWAIVRALRDGNSALQQFNQLYVAAQLTLLAEKGADRKALRSPLSCYGVNFAPLELANNASLSPSSSLKDLFDAAAWAARNGRARDWRALTGVLDQLVGNDPNGGCPTAQPGPTTGASGLKQIDQAALQTLLDTTARELLIPGAVVLLRTPQGVFTVTYGTTMLGAAIPPRADTHFRIASNTKTMTAAVIMLLAQKGKLGLDDPVSKYVPDVPNGDNISIAELLEMRSGLYNYTNAPEVSVSLDSNPTKVWSAAELLAIAFARPPNFPPGTDYEYSNTNYALLGVIAEKVDRKPLAQVMQDRLFGPLRMQDTELPARTVNTIPEPYSHGYLYGSSSVALVGEPPYSPEVIAAAKAGTLLPKDYTGVNHSFAEAAGGVISTADDLAIWIKALVGGRVLNRTYQRRWLDSLRPENPNKPEGQKYGYGISQVSWGPNAVYFHGGETAGYNSKISYDPANDMTLIVWTNLAVSLDNQQPANTLWVKVLDQIYKVSPLAPAPSPTTTP